MNQSSDHLIRIVRVAVSACVVSILFIIATLIFIANPEISRTDGIEKVDSVQSLWQAPDTVSIPPDELGHQIRYGRNLIAHTARYLGPRGSVSQISNGMNCQNCHLNAGTKPFGNNYGSVASLYPKFRARSGSLESIEKRVNDCIERSLNGTALDDQSDEMRAIVSYIKWLGSNVQKGQMAA